MKYTYSYVLDSGIPLGGIGTGSVEIRADGRLYEWTIFNNGGYAERQEIRYTYYLDEMSSFFAARQKDKVRVLQAFDYYYGGNPYTLPWLKPVRQTEFIGEPPIAYLKFLDDFTISMKAFSPFIPLDLKNSSLPACFVGYFRIIQKFINNYTEYYPWERVSTRGIGTSTTRTL